MKTMVAATLISGLSLVRTAVDPFDDRELALLEAFAAQAEIGRAHV